MIFLYNFPPPINGSSLVGYNILKFFQSNISSEIKVEFFLDLKLYDSMEDIGSGFFKKIFKFIKIKKKFDELYSVDRKVYMSFNLDFFGFFKLFYFLLFNYNKYDRIYVHNHVELKNFNYIPFFINFFNKIDPILISSQELKYFNNGHYLPNISFLPDEFVEKKVDNKLRIIFISHYFSWKGVLDILLFVKKLVELNVVLECKLFGAAGDLSKEVLINRCIELEIQEFVSINEPIFSDEEKINQLNWANFCFYPSKRDYSPLFLLEASQYGVPILAYDVGVIREILSTSNSGKIVQNVNEAVEVTLDFLNNNLEFASLVARKKYLDSCSKDLWDRRLNSIFN
jgi:glycosyltransferase involved in cell wall biosynthesis